jgi:hypothetical protein
MNKKMIFPTLLVLILIGLIIAFGFGKTGANVINTISNKIISKDIIPVVNSVNSNNSANTNGVTNNSILNNTPNLTTPTVNSGNTPTQAVKAVTEFPSDAPIYPNSVLTKTGKFESNVYYSEYMIDKNIATSKQVFEFYNSENPKQGWKLSEPSINDSVSSFILSSVKGEGEASVRSLIIKTNPSENDPNKTYILVQVTESK